MLSEVLGGSLGVQALVATAVLLVLVLVVTFLSHVFFSPLSSLPGPPLGRFGTFWQCLQACKGKYPLQLSALHRAHGDVVRIAYNEASLDGPDALRMLATNFDKAPMYDLFCIPNANYHNTMSVRPYRKVMRMRQNIAAGYQQSNIIRDEVHIDALITQMEEHVEREASGGDIFNPRPTPIDLGKWIHFLTMDIMGTITFSEPFGFLDQARDVGNTIWNTKRLASYITFMGHCRWLHWLLLGSPLMTLIDVERIPFVHVWTTCLNATKRRKEAKETRVDMMELWMQQRKRDPTRMPEHELLTAVIGNLGAGGDTPGGAIQAFFYFLLKSDPKYLSMLHEELDRAGQKPGAGNQPVPFAVCSKLPLLQGCLSETLRLFPAIGWSLPRTVGKEGFTTSDGAHTFGPGTVLSVCPAVIHRNREIWGEDVDEYRPERWLEAGAGQRARMEKFFIPFGSGYNSCLGSNVAKVELSKVVATLIRDFDFRLQFPQQEWSVHYKFINNPENWPVFVQRR